MYTLLHSTVVFNGKQQNWAKQTVWVEFSLLSCVPSFESDEKIKENNDRQTKKKNEHPPVKRNEHQGNGWTNEQTLPLNGRDTRIHANANYLVL